MSEGNLLPGITQAAWEAKKAKERAITEAKEAVVETAKQYIQDESCVGVTVGVTELKRKLAKVTVALLELEEQNEAN